MSAVVEVEQAVCIHRTPASEVVALRGADLTVGEGETLALVGPSGSGKSTLLALLSGLLRPSAGRVTVLGQDLGRSSERQLLAFRSRDVGVMMQAPERNLLAYASVRANLDLAQLSTPGTRRTRRQRAEELLDAVGMSGASDRSVRGLSGGEQQRVALAVALAAGPRLLLADEPTSQLDHANGQQVAELLRTTRDRWGTTVVVVTHDSDLGDQMDRSLAMRDGRIGTEARRTGDTPTPQQLAVIGHDGTVQLPPDLLDRFLPGGRARIVRRSSHVELHPVEPPDREGMP